MKEYLRLYGKTAVMVLVILHMAAVLSFSIPSQAQGAVAGFLRDRVRPELAGYLLATSQWQEWNLFAPDPQREVRTFAMDKESGLRWEPVASFEAGSFPWWRHATYAKLLPATLMKERLDYDVFRERFLQILCDDMDIAPHTMVRLREETKVTPYTDTHQSDAWWDAMEPASSSTIIHIATCDSL